VVTVDNKSFAAKVISKASLVDPKVKSKLLAEISIHRTLKHENIVRFHGYIEDKYNIYLILDLCENRVKAPEKDIPKY
jgi:serine/threonine protein kinase